MILFLGQSVNLESFLNEFGQGNFGYQYMSYAYVVMFWPSDIRFSASCCALFISIKRWVKRQ